MEKAIGAIVASVLVAFVQAQNLIPNPSFENYTECPSTFGQFDRVVAWEVIQGSADLFNACCIGDSAGVPLNFLGHQQAFDGQGYAGVGTAEMFSKEIIQTELITPLTPGIPAYVTMHVSPGGFGVLGMTSPQWASSGIGLRFSVDPLPYFSEFGQYEFDAALIYAAEVLNDTAAWQQLDTVFLPDSAYRYVQIGNFFSDANTTVEILDPLGDTGAAYAFVDQVCVSQIAGQCELENGVTGHSISAVNPMVNIADGYLTITTEHDQPALFSGQVVDALGRLVILVPSIQPGSYWRAPLNDLLDGVLMFVYQNTVDQKGVVRVVNVQP